MVLSGRFPKNNPIVSFRNSIIRLIIKNDSTYQTVLSLRINCESSHIVIRDYNPISLATLPGVGNVTVTFKLQ